ncbi:hypothetical protein SAMN05216533_0683 [Streptomyces sp. Ag109_O5-10]|nr:hypothetical protein SAMN05216533_0683 [Streptomyces sp. Ag109_O5-10]
MDPGAGFLVPGSGRRDRGCGRSAEVTTDPPIGPARRGHLPKDSSRYPLARVKAFVPDPLPWSCLAGGRAASSASGAVLDGTGRGIAICAGRRFAPDGRARRGVKGVMGAAFMGPVSLGAACGVLASRRRPKPARPRTADQPWS